jgi:curli biogenesis system outer membrane secretion channel CsgG
MRPMLRLSICVLAVALLWRVPTQAQAPQAAPAAARPFIAVLDFDYGSIGNWWGREDIGKGIAAMVEEGLVDDGSFRVIERKKLDSILAEQDFNASDRVDPGAKLAKIGKVLGVKYMLYGTITKFGTENDYKTVGGGAFGGSKFGLGTIGTKSGKAVVAFTMKATDTTTAEILAIAKGEGTSKRSGLLLGGAGGGGGKGGGGGVNMGASNFRETILGEATEAAVKDGVAKLIAKKANIIGG